MSSQNVVKQMHQMCHRRGKMQKITSLNEYYNAKSTKMKNMQTSTNLKIPNRQM